MNITKEQLQKDIANFEQQKLNLTNNAVMISGALQYCQSLLAILEKPEPTEAPANE